MTTGKRLLIISLMLLAAGWLLSSVAAATPVTTWATDPRTGCLIGYVSDNWSLTEASWTGPVVNGKAEGKGQLNLTLRGKDGKPLTTSAEAEMIAGLLDGKVFLKWPDGDTFDGYYKAGLREGKGLYKYADGRYYEGDYRANRKEGKGLFHWANGETYEGDWVADAANGKGIQRMTNGAYYEGDFKDGKKEGKGTYHFKSGEVYEGDWKNGKQEGWGIMKRLNGDYYEGQFKNGVIEGKGKVVYKKLGHSYEGDFKAGLMDGQGIYRWEAGKAAKPDLTADYKAPEDLEDRLVRGRRGERRAGARVDHIRRAYVPQIMQPQPGQVCASSDRRYHIGQPLRVNIAPCVVGEHIAGILVALRHIRFVLLLLTFPRLKHSRERGVQWQEPIPLPRFRRA